MDDNSLGTKTRKKLNEVALNMDKRLEKYWDEEIKKEFGFEEAQKKIIKKVLLHAKEHNLRQAKRLRAAFVFYGYFLSGKQPDERIWKVMEGIELVHTALLMHDDFMDEDELRRGMPTTQKYFSNGDRHYGDSMAVNVGDVVLCLGYERVLDCGFEKSKIVEIGKILMRGITNTAFGQIYDVTLPKLGKLTEEKILAIHKAKTAIYTFKNPLVIGGVLAELPNEVLEKLKEYSEKGGVAFQLQDDVLGVFGKTKKTGKSVNSDLLQGKSTLLVAKTLKLGTEEQKQSLLNVWGNKDSTKQEIQKAKDAIIKSGSFEYSTTKAKLLAKKAMGIAESLRKYNLNDEAIGFLKGIASYIVDREV